MTVAEKLTTIAGNQEKVYFSGVYDAAYKAGHEAGYEDGHTKGQQAEYDRLVDPTKIIEQSVSGSVIRVDDVSEIPHKCTVSVDKDATVWVGGKNFCTIDSVELKGEMCDIVLWSGSISAPVTLSVDFSQVEPFTDASTFIKYTVDGVINNIGATALRNNGKLVISSGTITEIRLVNWCYLIGAVKFQLETGATATAYEPYVGVDYPITAGQTVEVDSICPTMTLFADNDATITFGYHKSWGMQTEYDRFWDAFQQNGNKTNYDQAFAYTHWNDDTFNPKYDIVCGIGTSTRQAFYNGRMTSTKVPIRVKNTTLNSTFAGSSIKTIVLLELDGVTGYNNPFSGCSALESITIAGSIDWSVSFFQSPLLMQASVQSIIDHLKDLTGQTAQTLTFHADVGAKLTDEQKAAITAKNWTLVY